MQNTPALARSLSALLGLLFCLAVPALADHHEPVATVHPNIPRPAEPSSSLRPGSASPSQFPQARRIRGAPPSRVEKRRLDPSTPENTDARYSTNRTRGAPRSIGNPSEERRGFHRRSGDDRPEVDRRAYQAGTSEEEVRLDPKARQELANVCFQSCASPSHHPSRGGCVDQITSGGT